MRYFKAYATKWGKGKVHIGELVDGGTLWAAACQHLTPQNYSKVWPGKVLPDREFPLSCQRCLSNLEKSRWAYVAGFVQMALYNNQPRATTPRAYSYFKRTTPSWRDYATFAYEASRIVKDYTSHFFRAPSNEQELRDIADEIIDTQVRERPPDPAPPTQEPPPPRRRMYGDGLKRFEARFDSECNRCGKSIYEGDFIARTPEGDYIDEDCFDEYLEETQ